jgi:endonuclease-8
VSNLSQKQLQALIKATQHFSHQFYVWRKMFALRKHLQIHRKGICPVCQTKLIREKTGKRARWSYWCPVDQPPLAE